MSGNEITEKSDFRKKLIQFLTENLYDVLMLKKQIRDERLRKYHFSKGIGEDLYYLTESFYRQNGHDYKKHSMSDFITKKAEELIDNKDINDTLTYEHMVPKNIYLKIITKAAKEGTLTDSKVYELLDKYFYVCTVAKVEVEVEGNGKSKLPKNNMGDGWDGVNPFYRYEQAGIDFYPNKFNQSLKIL